MSQESIRKAIGGIVALKKEEALIYMIEDAKLGLKPIMTLDELTTSVTDKKALICPKSHAFRGSIPAAFIINLQVGIIHRLIKQGLYVYEIKKEK